jgi:hypothetical protein
MAGMQRTILYLLVLCVLLGIDIAANNGSVTRDIVRAMTEAGKSTTGAIDATVSFMVGK